MEKPTYSQSNLGESVPALRMRGENLKHRKIYVDVRTETTDIITAVQKDANSRFLDVYLKDNGLPIDLAGHEVRIYGKKYDGTEIYNDGEITEATNGRCQFELTDQALALSQDLEVQIVIYYNNVQILQSFPSIIHVKKAWFLQMQSRAVTNMGRW